MENVTDPSLQPDSSLQPIPVPLRNLQPTTFQHHPLTAQLGPEYDSAGFHTYGISDVQQHVNEPQAQALHQQQQQQQSGPSLQQTPSRYPPPPPPHGSFNVISPSHQHPHQPGPAVSFQLTPNQDGSPAKEMGGGHFPGMKAILDPPNLQEWREKLFNVNEMITLTEDEFQTYFPHVDNIYSHRSTQRYKRKPFLSHYWDCRLKGRPPGTPKTDDPGKKKRRRTARQRDLCDVKIKITEYFPGAEGLMMASADAAAGGEFMDDARQGQHHHASAPQAFGVLAPSSTLPPDHPGAAGARYYTIQRVNGGRENEGAGGGGGGHRHTLEESDAIKKNSVKRKLLREEKERKKADAANKPSITTTTTTPPSSSSKQPTTTITSPSTTTVPHPHPQIRSTGPARLTALAHSHPGPALIFCGGCFCPFTQRIWITLEYKQIPYRYVDTGTRGDAVARGEVPLEVLEVNPARKFPCIKHGNWCGMETMVLVEYLEDLGIGHPLLPLGDPQLRAHCRMWAHHINTKIIPFFDTLLVTTSPEKQSSLTTTLQSSITDLVNASHITGPFFLGPSLSFVDVVFAPWIIRLSRVLKYYRQWPDPEVGTRWESWVQAVEADERVRNTTSEEGSYRSAYEGPASGEVPAHGMMVWAHPTWMMEAGTRRWEVGDGGDGGVGRVIGP